MTATSQVMVRPQIPSIRNDSAAPTELPSLAPSTTSRIIAPIGAGAAGAGVMYLWARNGPARLRLGLMLFGAAAGAGITALAQSQRAAEVHSYLVSFASKPDYSQSTGTPASVYKLLQRHFATMSPPVESRLATLQADGTVKSYEGIPISNGYVVNVRNDKVRRFEQSMRATPNVGRIEYGDD